VTVDELCARHRRIAVDANVLIYVIEGGHRRGLVARTLMKAVEDGRVGGVMSAAGLAEVLTGPARHDLAQVERYNDEIQSIPNLRVVPFEVGQAADAAVIRGVRRTGLSDAIHLASARAAGATAFITNDRQIRGSTKLEVIYLDELEVDEPEARPRTDTIG
jgi:predicted nucleic acid-binding protein